MALRATGQLTSNVLDETHPAVDGDGSTFVLAYQQQEIPLGANHDIHGARLQFTGSSITVISVDVPIEATAGQDERNPHTTWLGPKHCVVFEEQIGTVNTGIELQIPLDVIGSPSGAIRIIAAYANGTLVIVWADGGSNDGSSYGVFGRLYNATTGTFGDPFLVNSTIALFKATPTRWLFS